MSDTNLKDIDPSETQEWLDALQTIIEEEGKERAHFLLEKLIEKARRNGAHLPYTATTAYLNTIPVHQEPKMPANLLLERKLDQLLDGMHKQWF